MRFDNPRNSREPDNKPPPWMIAVGVIVFAAAFLNGTKIPFGGRMVEISTGYFIGIPQLLIVGFIGYWFGKAKSAGDLAPDEDAPTFTERVRAFKKSDDGKQLCGVCAGLGEHTPVPAWIWRVLFILFAFASGFGLFLYYVLAFAMPAAAKPEKKSAIKKADSPDDTGTAGNAS